MGSPELARHDMISPVQLCVALQVYYNGTVAIFAPTISNAWARHFTIAESMISGICAGTVTARTKRFVTGDKFLEDAWDLYTAGFPYST